MNTKQEVPIQSYVNYDRKREVQAFDDSKAGVKGLVDDGIFKIPQIFVTPRDEISTEINNLNLSNLQIPVINLKHIENGRYHIVEEIKQASVEWGFFQIVNHGIPKEVMDEMIEGIRRFNEQPSEVKKEFYSRDHLKKVKFHSNFDLYSSKAANWRDTLSCLMAPNPPDSNDLPQICREIITKYSEYVKRLGHTLFELLAEALGLDPKHLLEMDCAKGHMILSHYYPACPEPDRTLGISKHSDPDFFTLLLQDHIGGLQVYHQNHWIDIKPMEGALVVNLGDLLQLMSNDKFRSAEHRVLANTVGPRVSIACFFTTNVEPFENLYGPIKELLSENDPSLYKETTVRDYVIHYMSKGLGTGSALAHLRL